MAPRVGLEPTTLRLTAACSTIELPRRVGGAGDHTMRDSFRIALPLRHGRDQACLLLENGLFHKNPGEQNRFRENRHSVPDDDAMPQQAQELSAPGRH